MNVCYELRILITLILRILSTNEKIKIYIYSYYVFITLLHMKCFHAYT